jgi:hypothetical protein
MIHTFWRLREATADNLGLACTNDGLLIGRTRLIERRDGRFVVRERAVIEKLLKHVRPNVDGLMPRLAVVASALNANDSCLAHITAVHLKIPDLPSLAARDEIEFEDALIRSVDWNPDLHPRTGTPPNPGWFAPTGSSDSESSPIQTAQNDDADLQSDASPSTGDDWVRLPPGDRIDELGDFLEWLANAKPEDEKAIRAEIKRYYYDVGDTFGGNALNAALSDVLEAGVDQQTRQEILDGIAPYAHADPADVAQFRNLTVGGILVFPGMPLPPVTVDAPSEVWKLGWAARGAFINEELGANLPSTFPVVDSWLDGVVTSIKSIDLNAATYQDAVRLTYRLNQYIDQLASYDGGEFAYVEIPSSAISGRTLRLAIPKSSMNPIQKMAIESARVRAQALDVNLLVTEF